ncbi:hypothetical protein V8C44DRAFT_354073 [Trichoderma aethiopicum]
MQHLEASAMQHSSYTQKTNPLFAGLVTPPESPIRSVESSAPQSPTLSTLEEADQGFSSTIDVHKAMEALSAAIKSASVESFGRDASVANSVAASPSVSLFDLDNVREDIYSIIENTVESKMSDAMGPLRMNINRLDSLESHLRREHTDIREQNDTMSRQLDLHYRTIEQNVEEFKNQSETMNNMINTQARTMNTMIGAQAENLAATINMVSHLSQFVTNLPLAINQVVHNAVQQQTQLAIRDIMFAQQKAMFSVSDVSNTRQSVSSDGGSTSKAIKTAQALQTAKATKTAGSATKASGSATKASGSATKASGSAAKASGSAPIAPRPAPTETGFTHHLPTKEQIAGNGRKAGRNLILWQRPRMAEKLLHCLLYEIDRQNVKVSWEKIAHRLHPGASGSSCKQYLNRSRNSLVAEGHVVAPLYKRGQAPDPTIRGYMRDVNPSDGSILVRAVGYGEYIEDPKVNESDALEVLADIKAQLEAEEASAPEVAVDEDFDFEDDISPATDFTIPDDSNIAVAPSPTPARHAAPRQSVFATQPVAEPQGLQLPAGQATLAQESIAPVSATEHAVADMLAASVWAENLHELQNLDADSLFELGIGPDFVNAVEGNSDTQSPAPVNAALIPVTQSPVPFTQTASSPLAQTAAPLNQPPVAFAQASPQTASISQAALETDLFSDIPADISLFPELGNNFQFVLGSETLHDPFSVSAPAQSCQAQGNPGGQYVQQPLDNSWGVNNC